MSKIYEFNFIITDDLLKSKNSVLHKLLKDGLITESDIEVRPDIKNNSFNFNLTDKKRQEFDEIYRSLEKLYEQISKECEKLYVQILKKFVISSDQDCDKCD
jgi:hypothetical protein